MANVARGVTGGSDINVLVNPGATGDMQIVRLAYSADGVETVVAADASGLSVSPSNQKATTATLANVNDSASSATLIASNSARKGFMIHNDSTSTLYINFGATASATAYTVKIPPDGYYESGACCYTGDVKGIWSADASGAARTTELT